MEQTESITHIDSSGKQKYNSDLVDRINDLPNCVLDVILSFLPTKDAVATSVLSKRWKFLWMSVKNLDFRYERDYWLIHDEAESMRFVGFVNRVLLLHDGGLLNKFCLVWYPHAIASHASSWINTAITKKVNELSLCLDHDVAAHERFDMPISVFRCDSLRSLVLDGDIFIPDAIVVCLPKLESLVLASVHFESDQVLEKLTSECPMLNYMFLDIGEDKTRFSTYVISSTSLRRLDIRFEDREYQLVLYTTSLEYLRLYGFTEVIFVQNGRLSSLVEAEFKIDCGIDMRDDESNRAWFFNPVIEAVRSFDCAKALNLSEDVMRALSCGTISLSTDFKRLVKLEIETCCCACRSLQDFIQRSNNLEVLTIHKSPRYNDDETDHDHSIWTAPTDVPICFSNSLKKVVIYGYEGLEDERAMIQYMLEHGRGLEVVQISFNEDTSVEEFELLQEIREFPRMSVACEIKELSTPQVQRLADHLYTFPWD